MNIRRENYLAPQLSYEQVINRHKNFSQKKRLQSAVGARDSGYSQGRARFGGNNYSSVAVQQELGKRKKRDGFANCMLTSKY